MKIIVVDVEKGVETCDYARGKQCVTDARYKIRLVFKTRTHIRYLCLIHFKKLYPMDSVEYLAQL